MKWSIYPFSGYGGSVIKNKYNDLRAITDIFAIIVKKSNQHQQNLQSDCDLHPFDYS